MAGFPPHAIPPTIVRADSTETIDRLRDDIYMANDNPTQVLYTAPRGRFQLGYFDVMCLVINRMIGTGIFNSPQRVMRATRSTGASLLLWCLGIVYCFSGVHCYLEYGLNVPRYTIDGVEQAVPRSGGDLNYLQFVYRKPSYRKNTILLSTCIFGVAFIVFGNMAGNSISFASRVMDAAGVENPSEGTIRGIAMAVATLTCFIHAFSRRFGIWLNNVLAIVKVLILLLIIVTAIVAGAGGLKHTKNVLTENTSAEESFKDASTDLNGYAHGFLAIIFSFSGFEQPNFVLGEISRPRRKLPISSISAVSIISILYMAVNISYMVVVPKEHQFNAVGGVALRFFELTLGSIGVGSGEIVNADSSDFSTRSFNSGKRIFNAFLAISSLGNIIVMTYTAARVKQEIAKEGILPFPRFFAQSTDMSLGRLLRWMQTKGWFASLLRLRWLSPEAHQERTPVGALVLHLISCFILIFATWGLKSESAYSLLTSLGSYVINGVIGTFIGLGILILRFKGPPTTTTTTKTEKFNDMPVTKASWKRMTGRHFNPFVSVLCASIYTIGNLWPVVTMWVRPKPENSDPGSGADFNPSPQGVAWFVVPTIGWSVIGLGIVWFLGFIAVAVHRSREYHEVFVVEKKPDFEDASSGGTEDGRGSNGLVMVHETVYLSWVAKETLRQRRPDNGVLAQPSRQPVPSGAPYADTNSSNYFQNQPQSSGIAMTSVAMSLNSPQMNQIPQKMRQSSQQIYQSPQPIHQSPEQIHQFPQPIHQGPQHIDQDSYGVPISTHQLRHSTYPSRPTPAPAQWQQPAWQPQQSQQTGLGMATHFEQQQASIQHDDFGNPIGGDLPLYQHMGRR